MGNSKKNANIKDFSFYLENACEYKLTVSQKIYAFLKRLLDVILSLVALIILFPLLLLLAFSIKLTSSGSVIFSQKRIGRYGKIIKIFKFRTMISKAPESKATNDFNNAHKYITKIGKFLRRTSLDELPQLFNVIKGDMSIIGPRPLILDEVNIHKLRTKNNVYLIRPGITGLAQINGRDFLKPEDKVTYDTMYLRNMSFWLDVIIFFKSIVVVFSQENSLDSNRKSK